MANPEHLSVLRKGVNRWNLWRESYPTVSPDLSGMGRLVDWDDPKETLLSVTTLHWRKFSGANFSRTNLQRSEMALLDLDDSDLTDSDLSGADLHGASFRRARLLRADLSAADCRGARFEDANLLEADLGAADLSLAGFSLANLSGAKLGHALFRKTDLAGANFDGAHVGSTSFADVDLARAIGLESVHHDGPSHISLDTIYNSRGQIPEIFLRGCGVPDNFIEYMHSLTGQAFEFYSCFISYSTKDQEFADRLYADLQNKGVRCWFAPHDIHGGRKLHEQIDEAIRLHDKLLLILSQHSVHSEWVKTEIAKARQREMKEGNQVLFPVRLVPLEVLRDWEFFDGDTGKDLAREIREYFIPDFSEWERDHSAYQREFEKLAAALKAVGRG
jgi:uncharacterized protein YjbI with pentapeptide repeats